MNKEYFFKRLELKQPEVLSQYHYDSVPETFLAHDKLPIKCLEHGMFYQKACAHLNGQGCPACGRLKCDNNRATSTEEFITRSKARFGEKFSYTKTRYIRQDEPLVLICPEHGEIIITPRRHFRTKHGCDKCDYDLPRLISLRKLLDKARKIHGTKYDYSRIQYINATDKVEIICPEHGSFWQGLYDHCTRGLGCDQCARAKSRLTLADFITKAREIHGDRYSYDKVVYDTNASMVTITCKKHGDFVQRAASHLAGNICKKCFLENNKLSLDAFIRNARKVHGNAYDYSKVNYQGNKKPVEIVCPKHGSFWQKPNGHVSAGNGCRLCFESKGEKAVEQVLVKYGLSFIREHRFLPYLYRFDFYLPELNIYIEFNGHQHYMPIKYFGGSADFEKTKERDLRKKQLVSESNGILLILTHLNLSNGTVETVLLQKLKKVYRYWLKVKGELKVYKTALDLIHAFNLPMDLPIRELESYLTKHCTDVEILF